MKLNDFVSLVAEREGKKKEVSVGNIREVLKVIRLVLLDHASVDLYKEIRKL